MCLHTYTNTHTHTHSWPIWCCLYHMGRGHNGSHFCYSCGNLETFLILWTCFSYLWKGKSCYLLEAETPILWPPDAKSWLIWKDPGKDWGQEEKGMMEDEMAGWHHRHSGHGFGWTAGVGDGQGGLVCCGSWGHKESDMTEILNWTEFEGYKGIIRIINISSPGKSACIKHSVNTSSPYIRMHL